MTRLADNPLVRAFASVPTTVQRKLLAGFAFVVFLLAMVGFLGIVVLKQSNDRVDALGVLPQRVAAYRDLQLDSDDLVAQLTRRDEFIACVSARGPYCNNATCADFCRGPIPTASSIVENDGAIRGTLDELGLLTTAANLPFAPPSDEKTLLSAAHVEDTQIAAAMTSLIAGDYTGLLDGNEPATTAASLDNNASQLLTLADEETARLRTQDLASYVESQRLVVVAAATSAVLALLLGTILAWVVVEPIKKMRTVLAAVGSGDFSRHVSVPNRDELGTLATDLNRMNDRLGHLYAELENASQHKSEFLANMSHELRTPLNAVIGFSEVLEGRYFGELNERQAEYVADIRTSGHHLLTLINDILDLSKIEAGRMYLEVTSFTLADVVQSSVSMLRDRAMRQGIAISLYVDPSTGVIEADERMVKQVLFNLLTNALKFTSERGHVDVIVRAEGDHVVLRVRDDGVGIAQADQARIFEEFQQVGTSHLQEGTGLGLAISRRFVELHGGSLDVESDPGQGSTFSFTLPRIQGSGDPEKQIQTDRSESQERTMTAERGPTTL
ncbi:MAG: sensor histidine kinase [Candidatus Cryosericum sp.]